MSRYKSGSRFTGLRIAMAARRILTRTGNEDDEEQFSGKSILPVSFEKEIDDGFVPSTGEDYLLMVR
jgi:hypothetical protein